MGRLRPRGGLCPSCPQVTTAQGVDWPAEALLVFVASPPPPQRGSHCGRWSVRGIARNQRAELTAVFVHWATISSLENMFPVFGKIVSLQGEGLR